MPALRCDPSPSWYFSPLLYPTLPLARPPARDGRPRVRGRLVSRWYQISTLFRCAESVPESAHLNRASVTQSAIETSIALRRELDVFLAEKIIDRGNSPYTWWEQNNKQYPAAAAVACRYLCVPATSVPSEHLFSSAGNVITKKRNLVKPAKAEKVIFLMNNLN